MSSSALVTITELPSGGESPLPSSELLPAVCSQFLSPSGESPSGELPSGESQVFTIASPDKSTTRKTGGEDDPNEDGLSSWYSDEKLLEDEEDALTNSTGGGSSTTGLSSSSSSSSAEETSPDLVVSAAAVVARANSRQAVAGDNDEDNRAGAVVAAGAKPRASPTRITNLLSPELRRERRQEPEPTILSSVEASTKSWLSWSYSAVGIFTSQIGVTKTFLAMCHGRCQVDEGLLAQKPT